MAYGQESFSLERVAATLVPFDMAATSGTTGSSGPNMIQLGQAINPSQVTTLFTTLLGNAVNRATGGLINLGGLGGSRGSSGSSQTSSGIPTGSTGASDALAPIYATGGLVFPYNPVITEGVSVRYDNVEVVHSNESYHAYRSTDNVRIELSNCVWTCDTFENARYTMAALHFLRTYSLMDFGKRRSGRPPSPMWFSAYGNYAFYRVPVLLERANWTFPNDVDYVGVPEPGTPEWNAGQLATNRSGARSSSYTWLPVKFEVSSISLIVQHAPKYWLSFNLDDYKSGKLLQDRGSFHMAGSSGGGIGMSFPNANGGQGYTAPMQPAGGGGGGVSGPMTTVPDPLKESTTGRVTGPI